MKKSFIKFLQKTTKPLLFTILLLGGVSLQSCNNFLDGGDFKEQLEKDVAYAEAKECTLIVASNASLGSFLSAGEKTCKVKYTTDVQFTVNSDDYIFKGLEAVNSKENSVSMAQYVEFKTLESDEKNGTYKIQIKLLKESNDILIRPLCILIPKVAEITPKLESSGCDQDSSIKITFNKAMNPETFGDFSCISISSDGVPLDDYFETPYFSEDKTALYIQPHCGNDSSKLLLTPDGAAEYKNISVEVNFTTGNEKDADGIAIASNAAHKYKINKNYGNLKKVKITLESDENMGSFVGLSQIECVVGYSAEVQFKVKKDSYVFKGLEANGSAEELESKLKFEYESESGSEVQKVRVRVAEDCGDITLKPNCLLLPKIAEITPKYESSGCDQDSTIVIKFNKELDPDTFGDFSCISVKKNGGEDLRKAGYFGTPVFSADNTALSIPTVKGKFILPVDSSAEYADITIALDCTLLKDTEGLSLAMVSDHTYRINKNVDNVAPTLTAAVIWSEGKTKELTDKDFASWSDSENGSFKNGDFSQNHVGGKIYLELSGSDVGAGVASIKVSETYFRTIAGDETTDTARTYQVSCEENEGVYSANYQLHSADDGVIKLDFALADYSGNVSEAKTFYVIKDTTIDSSALLFEENKKPEEVWDKDVLPYRGIRKANGNVDTFTLTPKSTTVDKFYSSYSEPFDIEVLWGYSESELTNSATKTANESGADVYTFDRDYTKLTYVKSIFTDCCGNTRTNLRAIPPILDFDMNSVKTKSDMWANSISITPYDIQSMQAMCNKIGAKRWLILDAQLPYWSNHENNFTLSRDEMNLNSFYKLQLEKYQGFSTSIHLIGSFEYADGSYWTAPLSVTGLKCDFAADYDDTFDKITMTIDGKPATTAGDSSYIKDYIQVKAVGIKNSGNYKITFDDYKTEKGKTTSGVKFMFKAVNTSTNEEFLSTSPEFYLPTKATYKLYIISEDSAGKKYTSSYRDFYLNGSSSTVKSLSLTEDLNPPSIPYLRESEFDFFGTDGYKCWYNSTPNSFTPHWLKENKTSSNDYSAKQNLQAYIPTDDTAMFSNSDGLGEIEYFFIPNYGSSVSDFGTCTEAEFESHQKNTITYDLNQMNYTIPQWQGRTTNPATGEDESGMVANYRQMRIEIPYDGLEEGFYTLCMKAKDANGNYAYAFAPAVNRTLGKHLDWTFDKNKNTIRFDNDENSFNRAMLYYYDSEHSRWVSFYGQVNSTEVNLTRDDRYFCEYADYIYESAFFKNRWAKIIAIETLYPSSLEAGFYDVEYVYLDYHRYKGTNSAIVCKNKNFIEGAGGLQVYCDKPILAHTMYCSKRLTQTHTKADAVIWENKGIETGLVFENSNFTYGDENLEKIPAGYYYATIVHFADGTTLMTDVKQK